jgi:type IV pilus assembly protein PilY1
MKTLYRSAPLVAALALTVLGGLPQANAASTPPPSYRTPLGTTPPDLTTSVAPNIAITFDDSGSMQNFYMGDTRPFDGGKWTTTVTAGDGSTSERYIAPWVCAGVIDERAPAGDPKAQAMNGVYYNPKTTYLPPSYADGTTFPDAGSANSDGSYNISYVWLNGIDVNRPNNNVTKLADVAVLSDRNSSGGYMDNRVSKLDGIVTYKKNGNINSDNRWDCTSQVTSPLNGNDGDANGVVQAGGPYYWRLKASVKIDNGDGTVNTARLYNEDNWEYVAVPASQYKNFANWFAYYRTRNMMTRTALSRAFAKIGNSVRIAWQNMMNQRDATDATDLSVRFGSTAQLLDIGDLSSSVRASFYDWMFQVVGGNSTPARAATIRAGNIFRAPLTKDANDPYWNGLTAKADSADLTCRKNFHMLVTDGYWNEGDPTAPAATTNPTTPGLTDSNTAQASQTLPDAKSYDPAASVSKIYGNVAGSVYKTSMANISWFFWATDLQPGLANNVKPYWQDVTSATPITDNDPSKNPDVYWNSVNDPATWQHVAQFFVTLGVAGTLNYPGDYTALKNGTKAWPRPANNSGPAVDDTWHGAINSRGGFFNASDPNTLVTSLVAIINSVVATSSSAVSSALNTGVLSTDSQIYVPEFTSVDWSGKLTAYGVTSTGSQGSLLWEAGNTLTNRKTARVIVTSKGPGAGKGVDFQYANLTSDQKAILDASDPDNVSNSPDNNGSKRVDWIRGSRTDEGGLLRTRSSLLGAIVNGQPLYVSYPSSGYRDYFPPSYDSSGKAITAPETAAYASDIKKSYSQFVADNLKRAPTLYVPANDGMLHVIDVTTATDLGPERWAYIPDAVYRNLWFYSKKDKPAYYPTVDATPISRDVFFGGAWHTILVGGLRYGGRGVYALDITKADSVTAAGAAAKVLWEFNSGLSAAANLGYTFGQPNVGRLSNGKWVVLVPAGYFPNDSTDPAYNAAAVKNGYSSLFVLDAADGSVLAEYKTPTTVNSATVASWGLASPVLGDYDNDQVDDVAFAGDLAGNLWRFDLSDLTKKTVDLIYQPAASATPLNPDQPITVMPRLFPDPTSQGFIVVFGTGKFLGPDDRTTTGAKTQSVYGVRDPGKGITTNLPWTRANLVQQQITEDGTGLRGITQNPAPTTALKGGWYFDLNISGVLGEKVVVTPTALFNTNRAIITSLIPTTADPCDPGRAGAVMVVDAATGGAAVGFNGTGSFGNAKYVTAGTRVKNPPATGTLPAATMIGGGQVLVPGVTATGSGATFSVGAPIWRRRSWRILNDQ